MMWCGDMRSEEETTFFDTSRSHTLEEFSQACEALKGEPDNICGWAVCRYAARDIVAAKQLADEAGCDIEDVLRTVMGLG